MSGWGVVGIPTNQVGTTGMDVGRERGVLYTHIKMHISLAPEVDIGIHFYGPTTNKFSVCVC